MAKRPGQLQSGDEERLPWLEPYRDASKAKPVSAPPRKKSGRGAGLVIGGIAAVVAALTAGYWAGQRNAAPQPPPAEIAVTPLPVRQAPAPIATPGPVDSRPVAETQPVAATPKIAAASPRKKVRRRAAAPDRKIRNAGIESDRLRAVRAAQERPRAVRPRATRAWPKMPSPGPAGQVIQLGAFKNPARAHAAYRTRLARYPLLGRMPRVVVPVVTKPRGRVLYVLRLGTTSRQQSGIVCRNLRASGDHCLVIG